MTRKSFPCHPRKACCGGTRGPPTCPPRSEGTPPVPVSEPAPFQLEDVLGELPQARGEL